MPALTPETAAAFLMADGAESRMVAARRSHGGYYLSGVLSERQAAALGPAVVSGDHLAVGARWYFDVDGCQVTGLPLFGDEHRESIADCGLSLAFIFGSDQYRQNVRLAKHVIDSAERGEGASERETQ